MIELQFYPEFGNNEYIELFYKALEPYGVRARDGLIIRDKILREKAPKLSVRRVSPCDFTSNTTILAPHDCSETSRGRATACRSEERLRAGRRGVV